MTRHIVISDTHSPSALEKAYEYAKQLVKKDSDIDAIVINGDILGIFSIKDSSIYKNRELSENEKIRYLQRAAPKFSQTFRNAGKVTSDMVRDYVTERYAWAFDWIEKFSKLKRTIFNLGNHESQHHLLVLNELPFLTGCSPDITQQANNAQLMEVVNDFDRNLTELSKTEQFSYVRENILVDKNLLILAIPGESHATTGAEEASRIQEQKTKDLIAQAQQYLKKVDSIIIYNHTQGSYNNNTGAFWAASPSLSKFMNDIPSHIIRRVFVQSHNHWSYTQFLYNKGFVFVLNNAGLHDGIFNLLDFDILNMQVWDADPTYKRLTPLKLNLEQKKFKDEKELISRFYDDANLILDRKKTPAFLDAMIKI